MSEGYQVVLLDLLNAADAFTVQAKVFQWLDPAWAASPATGVLVAETSLTEPALDHYGGFPAPPDTEDAATNAQLAALTRAVTMLDAGITAALHTHGTLLRQAHDNYSESEDGVHALFQDLMDPESRKTMPTDWQPLW